MGKVAFDLKYITINLIKSAMLSLTVLLVSDCAVLLFSAAENMRILYKTILNIF